MSMTTTSTASAASTTSSCHQKLYDIPTHDAACAMPMKSNYSSIMSNCCLSAAVIEYDSCDYYCLAQGQTVHELAECLIKGSEVGEVWCNTNANATATATATATGTGIVTLGASTTDANSATSTSNGAAGVISPYLRAKSAIGMVGLLLVGYVAGLFV